MSRKTELEEIVYSDDLKSKALYCDLIEEIIFIENQLTELKKLPFISINPKNNMQQRTTPAAKQYKELFQQYTNALKILAHATGEDMGEEESPLRAFAKQRLGGG